MLVGFHGTVIGGKLAERWVLGGTIQGDVKGIGLRAEGHFGMPDKNGDGRHRRRRSMGSWPCASSIAGPWHNLTAGAEYAYFSDGAPLPADYIARAGQFFPDELPYLGQHYAGVNAGLDIIPIVNARRRRAGERRRRPGLTTVSLNYNASNEVDLSASACSPAGAGARAPPPTGARAPPAQRVRDDADHRLPADHNRVLIRSGSWRASFY